MIGLFDSKSFLVILYNFNFESFQISCCYSVYGDRKLNQYRQNFKLGQTPQAVRVYCSSKVILQQCL